jgi:uncharacterized protein (DUF488 family)
MALDMLTVGHSNRNLPEFLQLLQAHAVGQIVDVRSLARSRHNPQFNIDTLPQALAAAGVAYRHLPGLGGLRRPRTDSPNAGWRNSGFRGFADYMQTVEFDKNLQVLIELARQGRIALMCAEALPWRCHRSLIADALALRTVRVEHIVGPGPRRAHVPTPWARVDGTAITYPRVEAKRPRSAVKLDAPP